MIFIRDTVHRVLCVPQLHFFGEMVLERVTRLKSSTLASRMKGQSLIYSSNLQPPNRFLVREQKAFINLPAPSGARHDTYRIYSLTPISFLLKPDLLVNIVWWFALAIGTEKPLTSVQVAFLPILFGIMKKDQRCVVKRTWMYRIDSSPVQPSHDR